MMKIATLLLPLALAAAPAAAQDVPPESMPIYAAAVILGMSYSTNIRVESPDRATIGSPNGLGGTWYVKKGEIKGGTGACSYIATSTGDEHMFLIVRFDKLSTQYSISGQRLTMFGRKPTSIYDAAFCFQNTLGARNLYCPFDGYQMTMASGMDRVLRAFDYMRSVPGCGPARVGF
jgi:hypothetical protein